MILILDNFDSFTYNLVDYFKQLHVDVRIFRNNQPIEEITSQAYRALVLSPGPGIPEDSGNIFEVLEHYFEKIPVLGICLGHQAIGSFFGAELIKAAAPMHGKISSIQINRDYMFRGLPDTINVVRYHSLVIGNLPDDIESIAKAENGEVMAIRHKYRNIRGVQFHPEAILTEFGFAMIRNWVAYNEIL